jgi:hypothetical protein
MSGITDDEDNAEPIARPNDEERGRALVSC